MFDDIPEDRHESFLCDKCKNGDVTLNIDGNFECNNCDFFHNPNEGLIMPIKNSYTPLEKSIIPAWMRRWGQQNKIGVKNGN